jgi:DNA polymerase III delta prime subunit
MVDQITDDMFSDGSCISLSDNSLSWLNKYAPKDFSDCFLKTEEKKEISQWIEFLIKKSKEPATDIKSTTSTKKKKGKSTPRSKNKLDTNCLFLHGPPGIGKTTIANLLFKKYNFDALEFNASDTRTAKIIQDKLNKVGGSHNVIDFMCNKKTRIAIILDEIDGLSSGDKGGMSEINNIISESRKQNTPFICISNNICKKTDSLKRKSLYIKLGKPSDITIKNIITKISNSENIKLKPDTLKKIITKSQGDIRRCVLLLEYIFRNQQKVTDLKNEKNKTQNITMNIDFDKEPNLENNDSVDIDSEIENYSRKLTELQPYEMCEKVLNSNKTLEFFLENFNFDQSMTNWYIYENFVKYIDKNRTGNIEKKIRSINEIFNCFTFGDILEKEIMGNQNFEFFEYINIVKTHGSSFWANYDLKRACYNKMGMMNYSTLLNRTSLEYSNSKGWGIINKTLCSNQDTNITTELCNIIYKKLENDDDNFMENVIQKYNIDYDLMEKIIKSSSFYDKSQTSVFTDLKKKIKLYYNN